MLNPESFWLTARTCGGSGAASRKSFRLHVLCHDQTCAPFVTWHTCAMTPKVKQIQLRHAPDFGTWRASHSLGVYRKAVYSEKIGRPGHEVHDFDSSAVYPFPGNPFGSGPVVCPIGLRVGFAHL